jgi:5-methylcytosine-specific restriction endonuclease McrA
MSTTRRARIFQKAKGICHICEQPIDGTREKWDAEHVIPIEISGDDTDGNLAPAHVRCHKSKTKKDAGDIAKCKRVHAKHTGAYRSRNKMRGGRDDKLKQKLNGTVVLRESEQ